VTVNADPGPGEGHVDGGTCAPCRGTCPVGTDAAAYVALIAEGRTADAYDVARAPNPFASICGRICAAPCERQCRRGIVDRPVAIRALKRTLTEAHGVEAGEASRWGKNLPAVPDKSRPSVGIVGAGPAGLSAAHDLLLAGHPVTLYEREASVGGMLVHGVPAFRLPRAVAEAEFQAVVDLGADVETGCEVGRDITVDALLDKHAALLVTVGCQLGRLVEMPGVGKSGVMRAIDFLRRVNAEPVGDAGHVDGPVVVVGGGSVAFDAARSAWRLTPEADQTMVDVARSAVRRKKTAHLDVTLIAPETKDALNALPEELERAEQEGVKVEGGLGVVGFIGDDVVEGVEVAPVLSLFNADGAFEPQLDESKKKVLPAKTVVLAIGQQADVSFLDAVDGIESATWGGLDVDTFGRSAHPRIFAAGDVATGPRDLIEAIAFGQRAASAIVRTLDDKTDPDGGDVEIPRRAITPPEVPTAPPYGRPHRYWSDYEGIKRTSLPLTPTAERTPTHEVEVRLTADAAQAEGDRCLRCDEHLQLAAQRCVACGLCADVCPYGCISLEPRGRQVALQIRDDMCIRCTLCVDRCPASALGFAQKVV
jgi:formate dehydrogenase beta subunit